MRSQFVLDHQTEALLNELAAARAGNRSFVVREAIRLYANLEDWLDTVEGDPGLEQMMAGSLADIEVGRVMSSHQLLRARSAGRGEASGHKKRKVGRAARKRKAGADR